jgi:hypothetical protein
MLTTLDGYTFDFPSIVSTRKMLGLETYSEIALNSVSA